MNLYRIISLETFVDILHNKRERYVRPATWEDTFEGYLYSKLEDVEARRQIMRDMYYNVCPKNYEATLNNMLKLEYAKWFVYGQSWSTKSESDAMWRIYSYHQHSIQIEATDVRLRNLLKKIDSIGYVVKGIKYDVEPKDNLVHIQVKLLEDTKCVYEPFLHKRKAFSHECERRVLITDKGYSSLLSMKSIAANWGISEIVQGMSEESILAEMEKRLAENMGHFDEKRIPNNYYVEIKDLHQYISGVKVNPFAEDWYVELIQSLCTEYGLKCHGRSKLYTNMET